LLDIFLNAIKIKELEGVAPNNAVVNASFFKNFNQLYVELRIFFIVQKPIDIIEVKFLAIQQISL
jgi:hypothetical protein